MVNIVANFGADLIIGILASPAAAGSYRLASRMVFGFSEIWFQPVKTIAWVRFSSATRDRLGLDREWLGLMMVLSMIAWPMLGGVAVLSEQLTVTVLGSNWAAAGSIVCILALAKSGELFEIFLDPLLGTAGASQRLFHIRVVACLIAMAGFFALARFGAPAAALAQVGTYLMLAIVTIGVGLERTGLAARSLLPTLLPGAATTLADRGECRRGGPPGEPERMAADRTIRVRDRGGSPGLGICSRRRFPPESLGDDDDAEAPKDCTSGPMKVPVVYANSLGWPSHAAMIARTAAALYPDQTFPPIPYGIPRLLRPLLKDIYGLSFPRRLSLISSERITAGVFGRRLLGPDVPEKLILLAGSTVGLVRHLSPTGTATLVTDMTMALAVRLYGARFSERDLDGERRWLNRCAKVFAMSTFCAESLRDDYGLDESRVELFLPPTIIPPMTDDRPVAGLPTIGFVGTDFDRKGGHDLLQVYRETLLGRANLVIVSADAPPNLAIPGVTCHGRLPHDVIINEILPSLDVFCLPSRQDCSSMAITEAMAAGVPIVSTTLHGIGDLVADGVTGILVPPGDRAALRKAIERMIGDVDFRRRCGVAARGFAEKTLAVEPAVRRLVGAIL